jgi:dihydroxyacetone kinase-like predicted kinase
VGAGEWLALVEERAVASDPSLDGALSTLVAALLPDGGVLEALVGEDGEEAGEALERCIAEQGGSIELHTYHGGQPDYALLVWAWID